MSEGTGPEHGGRPELTPGGVLITERHAARGDEHLRMPAKQEAGCAFFVSQVIHDVDNTRSVLSDYFHACVERGSRTPPTRSRSGTSSV